MRTNVMHLGAVVAALAGSSAQALADPLFPPPWGWKTDDDATVSVYFPLSNPAWNPNPTVEVPTPDPNSWYTGSSVRKTGSIVWGRDAPGWRGWGLSGPNQHGFISFDIDNEARVDWEKSVWLEFQMTSGLVGFDPTTLILPSGESLKGVMKSRGEVGDTGFSAYTVTWGPIPQPDRETIQFELATTDLGPYVFIRDVYISTHCVPAPGAAWVLGVVPLVMRRRR